jgi:hypothetical protein
LKSIKWSNTDDQRAPSETGLGTRNGPDRGREYDSIYAHKRPNSGRVSVKPKKRPRRGLPPIANVLP